MTRSPFMLADLNRSLELYVCAGSKRESMNPRSSKTTYFYLCQALCTVGPANSLWSPMLQGERISGHMWTSEYSFYPNYWPLPLKLSTGIILRCCSTFRHETRWEQEYVQDSIWHKWLLIFCQVFTLTIETSYSFLYELYFLQRKPAAWIPKNKKGKTENDNLLT